MGELLGLALSQLIVGLVAELVVSHIGAWGFIEGRCMGGMGFCLPICP